MAALIGGLAIGAVGGYFLGIERARTERGDSAAAEQPGDAAAPSGSGREFTDAPVAASPSTAPTAPATNNPDAAPRADDPAPAKAARRETASLLVRSSPPGADVTIDGTPRGTTPIAVRELELGTRTVVVSRAGYTPVERRIALTSDRPSRSVEVQLVALTPPSRVARPARPSATTSSLVVDSRPAGAAVTIDGQPTGVTPLMVASIAPGKHTVRIELPGYRPSTQTVDVKPGERLRVAASLEGGQRNE